MEEVSWRETKEVEARDSEWMLERVG